MIRTKGEPGTGDVVQAVRHMRMMNSEIRTYGFHSVRMSFLKQQNNQVPV